MTRRGAGCTKCTKAATRLSCPKPTDGHGECRTCLRPPDSTRVSVSHIVSLASLIRVYRVAMQAHATHAGKEDLWLHCTFGACRHAQGSARVPFGSVASFHPTTFGHSGKITSGPHLYPRPSNVPRHRSSRPLQLELHVQQETLKTTQTPLRRQATPRHALLFIMVAYSVLFSRLQV